MLIGASSLSLRLKWLMVNKRTYKKRTDKGIVQNLWLNMENKKYKYNKLYKRMLTVTEKMLSRTQST